MAVRLHVAFVQAVLLHQLFFFGKVVFGIGQQTAVDVFQQGVVVLALPLAKQRTAQFVEQIHQRMVLPIHAFQIGNEVVVPDKCRVHAHTTCCSK